MIVLVSGLIVINDIEIQNCIISLYFMLTPYVFTMFTFLIFIIIQPDKKCNNISH